MIYSPEYETLFEDGSYYRLPDGTEAQAIWQAPTDGDTFLPYWTLVPDDNPSDDNALHIQYDVQRDGQVVTQRWSGMIEPDRIGDLPKVAEHEAWRSDLTADDIRPA